MREVQGNQVDGLKVQIPGAVDLQLTNTLLGDTKVKPLLNRDIKTPSGEPEIWTCMQGFLFLPMNFHGFEKQVLSRVIEELAKKEAGVTGMVLKASDCTKWFGFGLRVSD